MAFYADFSGHYEKIFPLREPTFKFLNRWLKADSRILDLGCGTGHYSGRLAATGRHCLGVDLDPDMVAQAQKNYTDPTFRILDLQAVGGLKPGSMAGVFCIGNVLPHLPSPQLAGFLADVRSLLQPGGRWIFQTVNFDPLLQLPEYEFPVLSFPEAELTFQRRYTSLTRDSLLFQTRLLQRQSELFTGQTTLYPQLSEDYLDLNCVAGFKLLGHYANFTEQEFSSKKSAGSVYVFEVPG